MTQAVTNLTANVAALEASLATAMALLDSLSQALAEAAAGSQDPAIQALADKLAADKAALDAKVAADTPQVAQAAPATPTA